MSSSSHHATPSHVSTSEWQSFEVRMRRRRAERCRIRAEEALAAGFVDESREALEESRRLAPSETPTFDELVHLVEQRFTPAEPEPGRSFGRRHGAAVAASLVLSALAYLASGSAPERSNARTSTLATQVGPAQAAVVGSDHDTVPAQRVLVERDTVAAELFRRTTDQQSAAASTGTALPASRPSQPEPTGTSGIEPLPAVVNTMPPPPATPPPTTDPAPIPSGPPLDAVMASMPAAVAAAPAVEPPPGEPAVIDPPEPRIRAVLGSYASAFDRLDAAAVRGVWPDVDVRALGRAFDGLSSQAVSLGACDIAVDGDAATARCTGSATWTPRVGGGTRTEPRRWDFTLQRTRDSWHIVRATVR